MTVNVILPCAGKGSRLGLNYPKELFEVTKGLKLIDYSLCHLKKATHPWIVSVVITPEKEDVYDYVNSQFQGRQIRKVYFNSNYEEWPGSVYSAVDSSYDYNLVLLPDSSFTVKNKSCLLRNTAEALKRHSLVFGAEFVDPFSEKLKALGALHVNKEMKVIEFEDKPEVLCSNSEIHFNAFWGCYAFHTKIAEELYHFLISAVKKGNSQYTAKSFYPAKIFEIQDYIDLGTWGNIERLKSKLLKQNA